MATYNKRKHYRSPRVSPSDNGESSHNESDNNNINDNVFCATEEQDDQVEMGDIVLYWDGSDNRVNITSVLRQRDRKSGSLPRVGTGSCHCGKVTFQVDFVSNSETVLDCNCSICSKKGFLHLTVPKERVRIPAESLRHMTTYKFGTDVAQHTFCSTCGVQAIYVPRSNPESYSVNVRCLDLQGKSIRIVKLDGKTFTGKLSVK